MTVDRSMETWNSRYPSRTRESMVLEFHGSRFRVTWWGVINRNPRYFFRNGVFAAALNARPCALPRQFTTIHAGDSVERVVSSDEEASASVTFTSLFARWMSSHVPLGARCEDVETSGRTYTFESVECHVLGGILAQRTPR